MPGRDRTGPWGEGPMTGRGAGYCSGSGIHGFTNYTGRGRGDGFGRRGPGQPRFGRSFRRGFGRGRRWSFRDDPNVPEGFPADEDEEKGYLKGLLRDLEAELEKIKGRLNDLEGAK